MGDRRSALSPARFWKSLGWAWRGVIVLISSQPNARIHLAATAVVVGAGWFFKLTRGEWLAIVIAIGIVWVAEALNTAIEAVVDLASPEQHPLAGQAKDMAAGAVLLATLVAVVIGLLVFGPRLIGFITGVSIFGWQLLGR